MSKRRPLAAAMPPAPPRTLPRKRARSTHRPRNLRPRQRDAAAGQAPIEPEVGLRLAAAAHGGAAAPAPGSDAGQAVIEQAGGIHVGKEAARRVACDAGLVVLRHGPDGGVLDVGRRTRTLPTALRRALEGRDRNQCQFPGCSSRHCDAHHVVHWADGGATQLTNLVLLGRFHHRAVHEEGFQVVADAAGRFQFLRPDGAPLPALPPAPGWQGAAGADRGAAGGGRHHHRSAHRYPRVVWRIAEPGGGARRAVGTAGSGTSRCRAARRRSVRDPRPGGAAQRG